MTGTADEGHWQYGVRYEFNPMSAFNDDPMLSKLLNDDGTVTRERWAEDEVSNNEHTMRRTVGHKIPVFGANHRVVRRWIGATEEVDQ